MKTKQLLACGVAISLLLSSVLIGCKSDDPEDSFDPDAPGDDFSGSIADKEENNEKPQEPVDEGDETKTYYIASADDLRNMKRKGTYILTADIDLSGSEWTPIGTYNAPFIGSFDGAGHTITGLTVTKDIEGPGECISYSYAYAGLFGYADGATVKNVKLKDVDIKVESTGEYRVVYASAIVGMAVDTTVSDCEILSGSITAKSVFFKAYSAGITAFSFGSTFTGCNVNADISVTGSSITSVAGGLVAQIGLKTIVTGCTTSGSVSTVSTDGNSYSGGLIGYINNSSVSRCSSSANVTARTECDESEKGKAGACFAGGIAAYSGNTLSEINTISVVSSSGSVTATSVDYAAYAGGLTGYIAFTSVTHAYSSSKISASSDIRESFAGGITAYTSSNVTYDGIFFAGSLAVNATKDDPRCGLLNAYNSAEEEKPTVIKDFAYLTLSEIAPSINGCSYGSNDFPTDNLLIAGEEYTSAALKSKNILTSDLGWDASDWSFSMAGFPTVVLTESND
ncbi:MAG: hypothetical protein IJY04_00910 [Clostridia bacterium]|nr:hypothetical protein [Clostridia bacterium]